MKLTLNTATEADFEFVRKVHHLAYRDMVIRQYGEWDDSIQDEFFKNSWDRLPHKIIVCDGEPCGYCCLLESEDAIDVMELAILPEWQGKGIGSDLLKTVIEKGKSLGVSSRLNVMKTNDGAKRLYERLGFEVFDMTATHFKMRQPVSGETPN